MPWTEQCVGPDEAECGKGSAKHGGVPIRNPRGGLSRTMSTLPPHRVDRTGHIIPWCARMRLWGRNVTSARDPSRTPRLSVRTSNLASLTRVARDGQLADGSHPLGRAHPHVGGLVVTRFLRNLGSLRSLGNLRSLRKRTAPVRSRNVSEQYSRSQPTVWRQYARSRSTEEWGS